MKKEIVRDWEITDSLRRLTPAEIRRYARSCHNPTTFKCIIRDVPLTSMGVALAWIEDKLPLYADKLEVSTDVLNLYRAVAQMANAPGLVTRMPMPQLQLFLDLAQSL